MEVSPPRFRFEPKRCLSLRHIYRFPVAVLLFGIGLTCRPAPCPVGAAPILNTGPPPAVGVLGVAPPPNENAPAATAGLLG